MTLTDKLKKLGKYQLGVEEFKHMFHMQDGQRRFFAWPDFVLRYIASATELSVLVETASNKVSQGDYAGAALNSLLFGATIEGSKYLVHKGFQYMDNTRFFQALENSKDYMNFLRLYRNHN